MWTSDWKIRAVVPAIALAFLVGCGGGGEGGEGGEAGGEAAAMPEIENPGSITGMAMFTGTAPADEQIDMSEEPVCADKHDGPYSRPPIVVSGDGHLANVFIYVKEGLTQDFPAPSEPVQLDQDGCVYTPHVVGVQADQTLELVNSDGILHNINARPQVNRGFNISQPTTMTSTRSFSQPEIMIPVQCDVHGWMEAYVGVVDHPYFAVSSEDGSFEIGNLPPGEYTIEAWHEELGVQTASVTVEPNGTAELDFTYDEQMAENAIVPLGEPIDLHDHGGEHTRAAGVAAGAR